MFDWLTGDEENTPDEGQLSPAVHGEPVEIQLGQTRLEGTLSMSNQTQGVVLFVQGSGSSRFSLRNQAAAEEMQHLGLGTLLFDLLTPEEEDIDLRTHHYRLDIALLVKRTNAVIDWLDGHVLSPDQRLGLLGASTGGAAALIAAAERPQFVRAVVLRSARPDLAARSLGSVRAPALFLCGEMDYPTVEINRQALQLLPADLEKELVIIPGAGRRFEEPGSLQVFTRQAGAWFRQHLQSDLKTKNKG